MVCRDSDHCQINDTTNDGRAKFLKFLEGGFESSIRLTDEIIDHMMSLSVDCEKR